MSVLLAPMLKNNQPGEQVLVPKKSWFSRTFCRPPSSSRSVSSKSERSIRRKQSVSDLATQAQVQTKRDSFKGESLQTLVRTCGKSVLYLPPEYATGSLMLPTCIRATAQYLVQHGLSNPRL